MSRSSLPHLTITETEEDFQSRVKESMRRDDPNVVIFSPESKTEDQCGKMALAAKLLTKNEGDG